MPLSTQNIDTWSPHDLAVQLAYQLADSMPKGRRNVHAARNKYYAAWPYVEILAEADDWDGRVGPAREPVTLMVAYLLNNLTTWRGETAREFKRVLREKIGY